jgi:hypothetical protein
MHALLPYTTSLHDAQVISYDRQIRLYSAELSPESVADS